MDDYTEDEALEATEQEEAPAVSDDKELRKLKQENQSLRQRLRRTELEANFGRDVVELIPEELPLSKWEEYAGKLAERIPKQVAEPEQNEPAPDEPSQEEEPTGLAAVTNASAPGASPAGELLTVKEMKELRKTDPQEFVRRLNAGQFEQQTNW